MTKLSIPLYHGTSVAALPRIAIEGIKPRGNTHGNWHHTVKSNKMAVYLTNAYPLYFAAHAGYEAGASEDTPDAFTHALVEVFPDMAHLQADEDAIEQLTRDRDGLPKEWDMKRRTIFYRTRAHHYSAAASLEAMGTCAHRGVITAAQTKRVLLITKQKEIELVLSGSLDPIISVLNFQILGKRYMQSVRWMFDDEPQLDHAPHITRGGMALFPDINAALDALQKVHKK